MAYDLVVIGCGAGGLSAAVAFSDRIGRDAHIAVLERATREGRGGATRWTSSWWRITSDRHLDPAFTDTMARVSGGKADLEYCRVFASEVPATFDFLDRHAVPWIYFDQPFANRNTGGGLGMPVPGGVAIVDTLAKVIDGLPNAAIHYETEALALSTDAAGRVTGVHVRGPEGTKHLAARAVVIACGGFEGAPDLLREHLGPRGAQMPLIAPTLANNRGDGIRLTQPLGAAVAGQFDMFHGEPVDTRSSKPDAVVYAYPFGIVVNREARRFFDEGADSFDATFERLGYEIWANQNQEAWFIAEKAILEWPSVANIILTDQPPVEAATLAGLAGKLGLDSTALDATVRQYNAAIRPGATDRAIRDGKATVGIEPPKSNWATPIQEGPFIGYPLTCAITFTFGGIRSDARARVMRRDGTAIEGLYAAGEVTGLYYNEYPAGTSVLRALTFGRIAAREAAGAATAAAFRRPSIAGRLGAAIASGRADAMDIIHVAEMPWGESLVAQRAGGEVAHKRLFEGEEGTPDNYMLVMSKEPKTFFSPRHRHPWDQIRFSLEGRIPIAKGLFVEGGEIAYFPESAHYGPQEGGDDRIVLLLQFGGASGQGFIGPDRVKQAHLELANEGRFEGGIFTRDVTEGRRNWDAYEAIWLHVNGGELSYAPPVYKTPIVMRPDALPWLPSSEEGVSVRRIGIFPHRGLSLDAWRIEPGARHQIPADPTLRLSFFTEGSGTMGGEELRRWSAVRLKPGESATVTATSRLELLEMTVRPVGELTEARKYAANV